MIATQTDTVMKKSQSTQNYLYKLSGKRLSGKRLSGKVIIRETSVTRQRQEAQA